MICSHLALLATAYSVYYNIRKHSNSVLETKIIKLNKIKYSTPPPIYKTHQVHHKH